MKYFVILILIGFTGFIISQVFATSENLFSGTTTYERLPVTLSPNAEAKFEIKFQFTEGAYSLSNVTAIADIFPQGAASFVHFNAESFDVYQNSITRIPVTISIDPDIKYDKIFLNISYVGTGGYDIHLKSSWSDSLIFDIAPKEKSLPPCTSDRTACFNQNEYPCDPVGWVCGDTKDIFNIVIYSAPLKQIKSGIKFNNVECNEGLVLAHRGNSERSACVTLDTKIELTIRRWADDERILLGCLGDRVEKCYPSDTQEYRKALYEYYFERDDTLTYNFTKIQTINACTEHQICLGEFDNGTKTRISCDYPIHSCGVIPFDRNAYDEDTDKEMGTKIWEPEPTDGFTPTETPSRINDITRDSDYTKTRDSGNMKIHNKSELVLSEKELDAKLESLRMAGLPIVSSGVDYDLGVIVIYTPDPTQIDLFQTQLADTPFVLLYEEAPPRWEHDGPEPEPKSSSDTEP